MARECRLVLGFLFLALAGGAFGAEVGLVTSVSGEVRLSAARLAPFVRLHAGERIALADGARLQLVYFDGGRQESWHGEAAVQIGERASIAAAPPAQVRVLPPVLARQLAATPAADGRSAAGAVRLRALPVAGTLASLEKSYAELRAQSEPQDRNPELYLLAGYFELREFDKLDALLRQLGEKSPGDRELSVLTALYRRAVGNLRAASAD